MHVYDVAEGAAMNRLKCPFCGAGTWVRMTTVSPRSGWEVSCTKCGAMMTSYETDAEAITAWNRRALPTREEVAMLLYERRTGGSWPFSGVWDNESEKTRDMWRGDADAVLALIWSEP